MKYHQTKKFDDLLLWYYNDVYNQNTIDRWTKGYIIPFPKKSDLEITKNYQGITFTSIAAKIYNALLLNCIKPEIGLPKETVAAMMMLYRNTKVKVGSLDGDTDILDIVTGALQGDTLAPYQFIIFLDYVLRTSIDLRK